MNDLKRYTLMALPFVVSATVAVVMQLVLTRRADKRVQRIVAYGECKALCKAHPVEVRFTQDGELAGCRCDYVVPNDDVEVE